VKLLVEEVRMEIAVICRVPGRTILLLAFAAAFIALPARAASHPKIAQQANASSPSISVAELQRIVTGRKRKSDAKLARQLSRIELGERMSDATLQTLKKGLPGPKSRSALLAIADASAFLPPPPADVLEQAPPIAAERTHMLSLTVDYLRNVFRRLPDFYADETVVRYESRVKRRSALNDRPSWRAVADSSVIVSYRDGKEVATPRGWMRMPVNAGVQGLVTTGIFGPILSTVVIDAAHGEITWKRWERGSHGRIAIFEFHVAQNQSHYSIGQYGPESFGSAAGRPTAYHGELGIDPATGTIVRVMIEADPPFGSSIFESNIMVRYGPVDIGGKTYVCPLRSVSMGELSLDAAGLATAKPSARWLTDATFAHYHLFRSEMQILTGDAPPQ